MTGDGEREGGGEEFSFTEGMVCLAFFTALRFAFYGKSFDNYYCQYII